MDSYIPVPFPRTSGQLVAMVAPLWADFNFRNGGTLYYRVETKDNILNSISEKLAQQNNAYNTYKPTLAVVITWFESRLLRNNFVVNYYTCS